MDRECTRRIRVSLRREQIRRELSLFVLWYNEYRSHSYLGIRTPNEVYKILAPRPVKMGMDLNSAADRR